MDNNIIKKYLKDLQGDLQGEEKPEIKNATGPVYLYHGTRNTPEQIKKRGLTIKDNGSEEGKRTDWKKVIWFTSSSRYASDYTRKTHIFSKKVGIVLKCKLNRKYLKYLDSPLNLFDEYIYFKDVPPKDIEIVWKSNEDK